MVVIAGYLAFEIIPVNYRPVLINGVMEVSYPSSTTLLVLSVMPALMFQIERRSNNDSVKKNCKYTGKCFYGIHGYRETDFRCALAYGHYRFCDFVCRVI